MTMSITQNKNDQLLVVLVKDGQALTCRVIDFSDPGSYPSLFKELGYRCVLVRDDLAGAPWTVALEMEGRNMAGPRLRIEGWSTVGDPELLSSLRGAGGKLRLDGRRHGPAIGPERRIRRPIRGHKPRAIRS